MTKPAPRSPTAPPLEVSRGIAGGTLLLIGLVIALSLWSGASRTGDSPHDVLVTVPATEPAAAGEAKRAQQAQAAPLGYDVSGQVLGAGLALVPRPTNGVSAGYVIGPGSDPAALAGARLRVGDVMTEIDGRPLDGGRVAGLAEELASYDRVEIRFERNGRQRKRTLALIPTVHSSSSSS